MLRGRHFTVMRRHLPLLAVLAASTLVLAACANRPGGSPDEPPRLGAVLPALPAGEVIGQGTVLDVGGDVQLCLGAVRESWPPQCDGIPIDGWSWDGLFGAESSGDTTWGAYAVQGMYDGERFTVTQPPLQLALYDPMAPEDPTGGEPGAGDEVTLASIQDELPALLGEQLLSSSAIDGWLWVQVIWDDGTLQAAADHDYGDRMIVVQSALRPVG